MNDLQNKLKLKKNGEKEISKLNEELQNYKATISELEETSRRYEIEIANLIVNSPSPHGFTDFNVKLGPQNAKNFKIK